MPTGRWTAKYPLSDFSVCAESLLNLVRAALCIGCFVACCCRLRCRSIAVCCCFLISDGFCFPGFPDSHPTDPPLRRHSGKNQRNQRIILLADTAHATTACLSVVARIHTAAIEGHVVRVGRTTLLGRPIVTVRTIAVQRTGRVIPVPDSGKLQLITTACKGKITVVGRAPCATHVSFGTCADESIPLSLGRHDVTCRARVVSRLPRGGA